MPTEDEEMTATVEHVAVLRWLEVLYPNLVTIVKRTYAHDQLTKSLKNIQPILAQNIECLLNEAENMDNGNGNNVKIQRQRLFTKCPTTFSQTKSPPVFPQNYCPFRSTPHWAQQSVKSPSCILCKQAGRAWSHWLSTCPYLPPQGHLYFTSHRQIGIYGGCRR